LSREDADYLLAKLDESLSACDCEGER